MADDMFGKKVSVVIVTYFTGPALFESVQSVLRELCVVELVIVNNGNPPEVLGALIELQQSDPRIRLVSGQGNIGFAAACNLGAGDAAGDILLLLNPDGILPPGGIEALFAAGESQGGEWLVGARLVNPDGSEQQGSRREVLTPWLAFSEIFRLHRLFPGHPRFRPFNLHDRPVPAETVEMPVISGACMMLPLLAYRKIGGMDEGYFLHVEDIDFCLRFQRSGGKVYFCPKVEITHHKSSSEASTVFVEWHKTRGFWTYFRKNFKGAYPPGFLTLVNFGILCRFAMVVGKSFLARAF